MTHYIVAAGQLIILGGFCLGLYKISNGHLKNKVSKGECHTAQDGVKQRIDDMDKNINRRFDDLKDVILKNGKK